MRRLTILVAFMLMAGCGHGVDRRRQHQAKRLIAEHCAACHVVPGVALATGRVGPSLDHIAAQQIIAGHFVNSPGEMTKWIMHPQERLPGNAMPEMGLSQDEVRTIVDYLYTME